MICGNLFPKNGALGRRIQSIVSVVGRMRCKLYSRNTANSLLLRLRIRDLCWQYNNTSICQLVSPDQSTLGLLVKGHSIFCLEPVGEAPWRKSLSDSITFGCIPVLFSNDTDNVAPWFWGHWKAQGLVLLQRRDFSKGRVDLFEWLSSIPRPLLILMQSTLQTNRRQFQYSLSQDRGDGIHLVLQRMKEYAKEQQRLGLCSGGEP